MIADLQTGAVQEVNRALCRITGLSRGELVGTVAAEHPGWCSGPDRVSLLAALREHGSIAGVAIEIRLPDGAARRVSVRAHLTALAGRKLLVAFVEPL